MTACARGVAFVALLLPLNAFAQSSLSGSAEVTLVRTASTTDDQPSGTGSLWQNYTVGLHSALFDPRIVKYDGEVTFRTNSLSAASRDLFNQHGRQRDVGFRANVAGLSDGAFPVYAQVSRTFAGSTGELALTQPMLAGFGSMLPAADGFETEQRHMAFGGLMNLPGMPRAEVSYRRGDDLVTGGGDRSRQRQDDLAGSVIRETSRSRQSLRYQRSGYDYTLAQTFSQQSASLDYDLSHEVREHVQITARAGQRGNVARSSLIAPIDPADRPYAPPPVDGTSRIAYATTGVNVDPSRRFSLRADATWDRQQTVADVVQAGLGTATVHAEVARGLTVDASAIGGRREQIIDTRLVRVVTANGVGGVTYSGGPRWLSVTMRANGGRGVNMTPQGQRGHTRAWAREGNVSSSLGWLGLSAGYERLRNTDAILDYGNFDSERYRGTISLQASRVQITNSADQVRITRGVGATFVANRQQTFSFHLAMRVWRQMQIAATAGGFSTAFAGAAGAGLDRSTFVGGTVQATFRRSLTLTAWVRDEETRASTTLFEQRGLNGVGRVEYRLRTVNFALEYRHNNNLLRYSQAPAPSWYRGHQLRFSVIRQFGMPL